MGTNLNTDQDNVSTKVITAMTLLAYSRHVQLVVRVAITIIVLI